MELTDFLRARLDEDEMIARAAVDPDRPGLTWQWQDPATDEPIDVAAAAFTDEYLCEAGEVALRTVEQFPTRAVGPLPGFVVSYAQEMLSTVALHIARWDPARVLAEVEAKRQRARMLSDLAGACPADDWPESGAMHHAVTADLARHLLLVEVQPYAGRADFDPTWLMAEATT